MNFHEYVALVHFMTEQIITQMIQVSRRYQTYCEFLAYVYQTVFPAHQLNLVSDTL